MKKNKFCFLFILIFSLLWTLSCSNSSDDHNNTDFGIKYSFYLSTTTDQPWASVSGLEGSVVPTVASPEKRGYRFTGWKTKSGDSIPAVFGNVKLSFYAQWADINTVKLIGSKSAPDAVGDIIFTDGSASPYPEDLNSLTEEQWKNAVAMLFTTTYNPTNGQNVKGGQYQYKIAAGLVVASKKKWSTNYLKDEVNYGVAMIPEISFPNTCIYKKRLWNSIYIGYLWNENAYNKGETLPQLSLNNYFGRQNLVDSTTFKALADESIAPAFRYAIQYGNNQKIASDYKDDWYLPSAGELKILLQDQVLKQKYSRLLSRKYSSIPQNLIGGKLSEISHDTEFWSSSTGSQDVNSKEYLGHGSTTESGADYTNYYYGKMQSYGDPATKYKIWLYDPYAGIEERPYVSITPYGGNYGVDSSGQYDVKGDGIFTTEDCDTMRIEPTGFPAYGYAYKTAFYTKAYKVDIKGNVTYDEKLKTLAVIPVRVF